MKATHYRPETDLRNSADKRYVAELSPGTYFRWDNNNRTAIAMRTDKGYVYVLGPDAGTNFDVKSAHLPVIELDITRFPTFQEVPSC
mgnify:CR=1 FL=1